MRREIQIRYLGKNLLVFLFLTIVKEENCVQSNRPISLHSCPNALVFVILIFPYALLTNQLEATGVNGLGTASVVEETNRIVVVAQNT